MSRFNDWLYRRIDDRGRLPVWVRLVYRYAHWCPAMDDLLILTERDMLENCFCNRSRNNG